MSEDYITGADLNTKTLDEAVAEYCEKLTKCHAAELGAGHPMLRYLDIYHEPNDGKVYVRICCVEKYKSTGEILTRSAVAFVKRSDGTIWKPAGWKGPAKNFPRGNVFSLGERVATGL